MQTLFSALVLASGLGVIISVLFQEGNEGGLGTIGGDTIESLFGSNRGTSKEAMLQRITVISAVIFIISTLVLAAN